MPCLTEPLTPEREMFGMPDVPDPYKRRHVRVQNFKGICKLIGTAHCAHAFTALQLHLQDASSSGLK